MSTTTAAAVPVRQLPASERPRERLRQCGPEALSSAELVAILLGTGIRGKSVLALAHEIVVHFRGIGSLSRASFAELSAIKGVGPAKAIQLMAAFGLGRKLADECVQDRLQVTTPAVAYRLLAGQLERQRQEVVAVLLLDVKTRHMETEIVSVGTLSQVLVHPREIFRPAIRGQATSIIIAHNHPSGDPAPSQQDLELTSTLLEAGRILDIPLRDHLIIGRGCYISLRDHGYMGQSDKTRGII